MASTTAVLEEKCLETPLETASAVDDASAATQDQCRHEQSCTITSPHSADPTEIASESPVADTAVEHSFESPIIAEYTRENLQSDRPELEQAEWADESKGKSAEATSAEATLRGRKECTLWRSWGFFEASWRPSLRAVASSPESAKMLLVESFTELTVLRRTLKVSRKAEQATADDFEATEVEGDIHSLSEHAQARCGHAAMGRDDPKRKTRVS